jgi:outer membrane scaffolding protein for murein synthesis (MipA/OmpV family)
MDSTLASTFARPASKSIGQAARRLRSLLAWLMLLVPFADASAGRLLDWIRDYDLNDYSLGVAISTSENPYIGASNSRIAYPYLTSFRHSAFTDDWLLVRGENLGVRYITPNDWEIGIIGRLQTIGLGDSELTGLDNRGWAVETGPLLGWRGRKLHVQSRTYWPLPGNHPGSISELELMLPAEFARGYFVPSVTFSRLSSSYSRYYYGVTEREAAQGRPAYDPGAATNYKIGFTLGYELTDHWLLSTTLGLEYLDSVIVASPIVGKDRLWSASIGLAYNADVFQPKAISDETPFSGTFKFRAAAFHSTVATDIRRNAEDGGPGETLDFEEFLGTSDSETVLQTDVIYRIGRYHRLKASFFEIDRSLRAIPQQDFEFGDEVFRAGTEVVSTLETRRLGLLYGYSLIRDAQKEIGVQGGLMFASIDLAVIAEDTGQAEQASIDAPLPTIGIFGSVALGQRGELGIEAGLFGLDFDRYTGYSGYISLTLERTVSESFALGVGYEHYVTRIESTDSDLRGLLRARNTGPRAYLSWVF